MSAIHGEFRTFGQGKEPDVRLVVFGDEHYHLFETLEGFTTAPVCGYLRELAGWCDKVIDLSKGGEFKARHGDYTAVLKYPTPNPTEYFSVENRSRLGLDQPLPSSRLAVYHCDTQGSNEFQEGSDRRHYQCALLQADGRQDLGRNDNPGDEEDLFASLARTALAHDSRPSSRRWDGSDSGLTLSDVSPPGREVKFRVGPPEALLGRDPLRATTRPRPFGPDRTDHSPEGNPLRFQRGIT